MKKEGFVFLESVVVLVVVMLALTMLLLTYSLISRRTEEKEDYNKSSDIYLLYSINKMGATEKEYYKVESTDDENEIKKSITDRQYPFAADKDTCDLTYMGKLLGTTTDSDGNTINECLRLFDTTDLVKIYTVYDVFKALNDQELTRVITKTNNTKKVDAVYDAINKYDNGTIEYMKTLSTCKVTDIQRDSNGNPKYDSTTGQLLYQKYKESIDTTSGKLNNNCTEPYHYMIGVFKRSGVYYYASIEIPGIEYTILLDSGKNVTSPGNKYLILKSGSGYYDRNDIQVDKITIPLMDGKTFSGYYEDKNECSKSASSRTNQIIDASGNIKVSNAYFNKDTKLTACWDNNETQNDNKNDNNKDDDVVGLNCKYEGTLTQGATYTNGQYTYKYKQEGTVSGDWKNISTNGWGVMLTNTDSTEEVNTKLCNYINGLPIVSMSNMFTGSKAQKVDLSSFNTSNVVNMNQMFYSSNIPEMDLSNFDTKKVQNMAEMFGFAKATKINLNNLNTSNVKDMTRMFDNSEVTSLNLKSFNTSNVTSMWGMFTATKILSLDLSSFNTHNVTNMTAMFAHSQFQSLDLSNFDTSNVTNMSGMFIDTKATNLVLNSFNTKKVTDMSDMFSFSQATTLDLSSFDLTNVGNIEGMFNKSKITKVYVKSQADANKLRTISTNSTDLVFSVK